MNSNTLARSIALILVIFMPLTTAYGGQNNPPNIIFAIMDDVGVDQLELFGYGGIGSIQHRVTPNPLTAKTPVLNALAAGGVKFRNAWASPECSPSRVSFFNGRYPMRHHVMAALLPPDLAYSQEAPFETTTPTILKKAGYKSALFGKSHFTNFPVNDPTPSTDVYGSNPVTQLGWDFSEGWYMGGPNSIDTTAGGIGQVDPATGLGPYKCGYITNETIDSINGANSGACWMADGSCQNIGVSPQSLSPGFACLQSGGILRPKTTCAQSTKNGLNFSTQNAYYVSQHVIQSGNGQPAIISPVESSAGRAYRTTLEANYAINWIKQQSKDKPWMATLSFSSAHTPYQPAPDSLVYSKLTTAGQDCSDSGVDSRALMTQMIESLDKELGRILIETGIATNVNGNFNYDPKQSNTVIVVVGDNGSYANNVRLPFDPAHSKGTVYQTGVWVPMIVAGPVVSQPGRSVESMVNIVDLFKLFGDLAGVDVRAAVPSTVALDSQPMMPYLTNPNQDKTPIRTTNFTQYGENTRSTSFVNGACVIPSVNTCGTLFPSQTVCEINYAGIWYGKGTTQPGLPSSSYPNGLTSCCQVNQYLAMTKGTYTPPQGVTSPVAILPDVSYAIRDASYKLIEQSYTNYNPSQNPMTIDETKCITSTTDEFYQINQKAPVPLLDHPTTQTAGSVTLWTANNLLPPGTLAGQGGNNLNGIEKSSYDTLYNTLVSLINSAQPCLGDANLDGVIDGKDLDDQNKWIDLTKGTSTWWDMNQDGYTNAVDRGLLTRQLMTRCNLPR